MAKIPFGILGPFIGKVGPVIGYIRKDTWCIRSMPSHYRDARTPAQLINRNKMTRLMQFLCSMKPVIQSSFDVPNSDNPCRTEFNMAFAANFNRALRPVASGTEILYSKIQLADGLLSSLSGTNAYQTGNDVHISWSAISTAIASSSAKLSPSPADHLCLCAHNPNTNQSIWNFRTATRHNGNAIFTIPEGWTNTAIHLWAWFSSPISTSPSIYLGEFSQPASHFPSSEECQKVPGCVSKNPLYNRPKGGHEHLRNKFNQASNLQSTFYNLQSTFPVSKCYQVRTSSHPTASQQPPSPPPKPTNSAPKSPPPRPIFGAVA